jgi:putative colanic acid biosynthesis UDP-glucose lipid carrier transferase
MTPSEPSNMETRHINILRFTLAITDIILVNLSFFLGFQFAGRYSGNYETLIYNQSVIACNIIWILSSGIFRLYTEGELFTQAHFYRSTFKTIILHVILFLTFFSFSLGSSVAAQFLISSYALLIFGFLMSRFTGSYLIKLTSVEVTHKSRTTLGIGHRHVKHHSKHKTA